MASASGDEIVQLAHLTTCQENRYIVTTMFFYPLEDGPVKMMTIGELKARFSEVLEQVKQGETVVICYGKQKEKVAAIIPYHQLIPAAERPLGLLQERASCTLHDDFAVSDEEFLNA